MFKTLKMVLRDESGATAIEYGLIAALVSVAAVTALQTMGDDLGDMFGFVSTTLDGAMPAGAGGSGGSGG